MERERLGGFVAFYGRFCGSRYGLCTCPVVLGRATLIAAVNRAVCFCRVPRAADTCEVFAKFADLALMGCYRQGQIKLLGMSLVETACGIY
jgi:hypothetical protein